MNAKQQRITIKCAECGGSNVMRDAWAVWDDEEQDWILGAVMDEGYCEDCDGEATLTEEPLSPSGDEAQPGDVRLQADDAGVLPDDER